MPSIPGVDGENEQQAPSFWGKAGISGEEEDAVDGNQKSGINSPVEGKVGLSPCFYKVLYISGGCLGFLNHQQYHILLFENIWIYIMILTLQLSIVGGCLTIVRQWIFFFPERFTKPRGQLHRTTAAKQQGRQKVKCHHLSPPEFIHVRLKKWFSIKMTGQCN